MQLGESVARRRSAARRRSTTCSSGKLLSPDELAQRFGLDGVEGSLLVTYHPVTLEWDDTPRQVGELLAALGGAGLPVVFTYRTSTRAAAA